MVTYKNIYLIVFHFQVFSRHFLPLYSTHHCAAIRLMLKNTCISKQGKSKIVVTL
jgi:hypothetical protein